jgi:hypothetical protein
MTPTHGYSGCIGVLSIGCQAIPAVGQFDFEDFGFIRGSSFIKLRLPCSLSSARRAAKELST